MTCGVRDRSASTTTYLRRKIPLRKRLLLAAGGLVFGFIVGEVGVRAFVPVRNVGPSFTVFDPVYGKRLKKNFSCRRITPEFTMRFTTNSVGFRGPEPKEFANRPILFIGDSFTMGYGVSDGEEYPALVSEALAEQFGRSRFPVVNAGIGDIGNGRWCKFLKTDATKLNPRCVVLQLSSNDFHDNVRENLFGIDESEELVDNGLQPSPGMRRRAQGLVEFVPGLVYSRLVSLLRQGPGAVGRDRGRSASANGTPRPVGTPPFDRLTYRLIEEIVNICRARGYSILALTADIGGERLGRLKTLFDALNVPYVAVPAKSVRPDMYYTTDGHWTADGHSHVAKIVASTLIHLLGVGVSDHEDVGQRARQGADASRWRRSIRVSMIDPRNRYTRVSE